RKKDKYITALVPLLDDEDSEIITQAAKMIGDVRYGEVGDKLISLLKHPEPRVRLYATEALGRTAEQKAFSSILQMLEENNDEDAWLRHAGIIALARIENAQGLIDLCNHPSRALRTAAVVALRRMRDPGIVCFLNDKDEYIITETARAINDDYSIEAALPALAALLKDNTSENEALLRRIINANVRLGTEENLRLLSDYAKQSSAPEKMRAEAIAALGTLANPSVLDRVDGRYRGEVKRESLAVGDSFGKIFPSLLADAEEAVKIAAIKSAGKLGMTSIAPSLFDLLSNSKSVALQKATLDAMQEMKADKLGAAIEIALNSKDENLRSHALTILPESGISETEAVALFRGILDKGSRAEKRAALSALGAYTGADAIAALQKPMRDLMRGRIPRELRLDVIEAVENQADSSLMRKLKQYHASKGGGKLAEYQETLYGGNVRRGRNVFYRNEQAQCVRCHAVFEYGGNAGPGLANVGKRLTKPQLLESLIDPSASFAAGFGMVSIKLNSGESAVGILMNEDTRSIQLRMEENELKEFAKKDIASRVNVPSSMPPMGNILKKSEIRDVIAFLASLEE
ncbi:MAG: HEAT repeat domain-containing protein, partial [Bacteroidota bacterium]